MKITQTINVLTLSALLVLTGCFGLIDDEAIPPVDGQSTNNTAEINHPPALSTSEILNQMAADNAEPSYDDDDELIGFEFMLYHAAVDIDGDNMTMGWDTNSDGTIDLPVTESSGLTSITLPVTAMNELSGFDEEGVFHAMLAFIAVDEHGMGDALFVETFLYDWGGSSEGNTDGNLALYAFSGEDAQGNPSDGTEDNLIMLTMTQGGDINWASISVKLQIDGGAPVTCDNPGGSGGVCVLEEFGTTTDQVWSVGDGVTIKETGTDLCTASCTIDVTITDTNEGMVIYEVTDVPAE